jgi:hypothetical protein
VDEDEFDRRMLAAASHHAGGVRRDLAQIWAEMNAADGALRRRRNAVALTERAGELGEDRQIDVRPGPSS